MNVDGGVIDAKEGMGGNRSRAESMCWARLGVKSSNHLYKQTKKKRETQNASFFLISLPCASFFLKTAKQKGRPGVRPSVVRANASACNMKPPRRGSPVHRASDISTEEEGSEMDVCVAVEGKGEAGTSDDDGDDDEDEDAASANNQTPPCK